MVFLLFFICPKVQPILKQLIRFTTESTVVPGMGHCWPLASLFFHFYKNLPAAWPPINHFRAAGPPFCLFHILEQAGRSEGSRRQSGANAEVCGPHQVLFLMLTPWDLHLEIRSPRYFGKSQICWLWKKYFPVSSSRFYLSSSELIVVSWIGSLLKVFLSSLLRRFRRSEEDNQGQRTETQEALRPVFLFTWGQKACEYLLAICFRLVFQRMRTDRFSHTSDWCCYCPLSCFRSNSCIRR